MLKTMWRCLALIFLSVVAARAQQSRQDVIAIRAGKLMEEAGQGG